MLAVAVFRLPTRRWGVGRLFVLVLFVLFLPNGPYVVTDLVHLRSDVVQTSSDAAVYAGILPLYVVFIGLGFASYALALHEVGAYLRRVGRSSWVRRAELTLHGLCAVGVLLGRVARLNSWDTFASPGATAARALETPFVVGAR